jgi:hypothetical protein
VIDQSRFADAAPTIDDRYVTARLPVQVSQCLELGPAADKRLSQFHKKISQR